MPDPGSPPDLESESAPAVGSFSIRALRLRSVLALALLAALSAGGHILIGQSLRAQETAAAVLRASAHQRLLADRIIVLSVRLLNMVDPQANRERVARIGAAADELEQSHLALMGGPTTPGLGGEYSAEVAAIYRGAPHYLDLKIRTFLERARVLASSGTQRPDFQEGTVDPSVAYFFDISSTSILEELSEGLDALVEQFQRESDARLHHTLRLELAVLGTTILVLLAMALFVFRPMIARVRRDIDELQHAGQKLRARALELERSNAELEQFAYVASHDLQEPLRMIAAYVQLLARRYGGKLGADADECIQYASDGAARMHRLILDLLAFSRVGTHGGAFQPADLDPILQHVRDDLQVAIRESKATVVWNGLPRLHVDPHQIGQLFQNLIANAIKFRRAEPPDVRIDAWPEVEHWHFTIRDNGIGFEMRFAERIFVIFQRLHARDRYAGTGVGLAICKKIVERHGGRIWAESEPGRGSTFHFTLPAEPDQGPQESSESSS